MVKVQLPASYPHAAPLVTPEDLPEGALSLDWRPGKSDLGGIVRAAQAAVGRLQDLWAGLEDLDRCAPGLLAPPTLYTSLTTSITCHGVKATINKPCSSPDWVFAACPRTLGCMRW